MLAYLLVLCHQLYDKILCMLPLPLQVCLCAATTTAAAILLGAETMAVAPGLTWHLQLNAAG